MKTNDLKKGDRVQLRNGNMATVEDNLKGNTRTLRVEGMFTESGSVYSHDIMLKINPNSLGKNEAIEHTPAQLKLRDMVKAMGF